MTRTNSNDRVLSIYVTARGFAFIVFEGPLSPIDWGTREVSGRRKNEKCLDIMGGLIDRYCPDTIVIEDCPERSSRRSARVKRLYRNLAAYAINQCLDVRRFGRGDIQKCFGKIGAVTKHEIAGTVSRLVPALAHRMPPVRKPWMSEDPRMNIFDAAALAWTFYSHVGGRDDDSFHIGVRT